MSLYEKIVFNLPEVQAPLEKKLPLKTKLKWTLLVLVLFFIMGLVPLYGADATVLKQFEMLSVILGASFGSIITLGIGPMVTASIVLQLLNGSGIVKFDTSSSAGRKKFQGTQKLLSYGFIILEAFIYVMMGGLKPDAGVSPLLIVFQLLLGGIMIMFMDDLVTKWGIGSGISLFIAAGVSQTIFIRALNWLPSPTNPDISAGAIPALVQSLARGDPTTAALMFSGVFATALVFVVAVYVQSMKIEIPLTISRIRGYSYRWPLNFIYTSNIPVILVAALLANIQLWARLLQNWGHPILGTFSGSSPASGFILWVTPTNLVSHIIQGSFTASLILHALVYVLFLMTGAVVFSWFWVQTSGQDAGTIAKQIMNSGLSIPGFRKDPRMLEYLLNRYIKPLTVMGALAVGFLAALADLTGAFGGGTGILLTVMIVYKMFDDVSKQHTEEMSPLMQTMGKR
ncbi:MAG: preprotein translocase subunit SecY [Candidatus Woesearchaeota archaeon]|jgi:preprotein translocase subunit SecY